MPGWASALLAWLIRLLAGSAATAEATRLEVKNQQQAAVIDAQEKQMEAAARPAAGRDDVLERMRADKF